MDEIYFLSVDQIKEINKRQVESTSEPFAVLKSNELEGITKSPQVSFSGEYAYDLVEMTVSYLVELSIQHCFMQGNKRTATVTALTFLQKNGYAIKEFYKEEIATVLLEFLDNDKNTDREYLVDYIAERAYPINE